MLLSVEGLTTQSRRAAEGLTQIAEGVPASFAPGGANDGAAAGADKAGAATAVAGEGPAANGAVVRKRRRGPLTSAAPSKSLGLFGFSVRSIHVPLSVWNDFKQRELEGKAPPVPHR